MPQSRNHKGRQREKGLNRPESLPAEGPSPHPLQRRKSRIAAIRGARRRILHLLLITLAGVACIAVLTSPLLSIKRIQIQGEHDLRTEEKALLLRTVSIRPGTNWLLAPVGSMERQLRELPWMSSVRVSRRLPDTIQVALTLRESRFLVQTQSGLFELDPNGVPIRPARRELKGKLPLIVLNRPYPLNPGIPAHDEALTAAMQIYNTIRRQNTARISKIEVDQSGNICLNMEDGLPIQMGQAEDIPVKIELVQNLYKKEPTIAGRLTAINLSCPAWPACTMRDPTPPVESNLVTGVSVIHP